jgi:hypothetical protein
MEKVQLEFKFLETCQPSELVRLNLGDRTEWAIVGRPSNALFPVLVLTGEDAPRCLNAAADSGGNLKLHFQRVPTLSYGHGYTLLPELAGPCDVSDGPLFSAHGALIIVGFGAAQAKGPIVAADRRLLRIKFDGGRPFVFFDLNGGHLTGTPDGNLDRAAFGKWSLLLDENPNDTKGKLPITQFSAGSPS